MRLYGQRAYLRRLAESRGYTDSGLDTRATLPIERDQHWLAWADNVRARGPGIRVYCRTRASAFAGIVAVLKALPRPRRRDQRP